MFRPAIRLVATAGLRVSFPGWVELVGPKLGGVWPWFGEGKVWLDIVPTLGGNTYLIGRRLSQHEFLP